MVDLGSPVFGRQGDVLDQVVAGLVEEQACGGINNKLPDLALGPGRFDHPREDGKGNQVPERGEERLKNRGVVHPSSLT